jgi:hypothetical protein
MILPCLIKPVNKNVRVLGPQQEITSDQIAPSRRNVRLQDAICVWGNEQATLPVQQPKDLVLQIMPDISRASVR